jgi:hypothetical protein
MENFIPFRKLPQDRSNHIVLTRYVGGVGVRAARRSRASRQACVLKYVLIVRARSSVPTHDAGSLLLEAAFSPGSSHRRVPRSTATPVSHDDAGACRTPPKASPFTAASASSPERDRILFSQRTRTAGEAGAGIQCTNLCPDRVLQAVGDKIPSVELDHGFAEMVKVDLAERCAGRKVILLGLPGAFTPC